MSSDRGQRVGDGAPHDGAPFERADFNAANPAEDMAKRELARLQRFGSRLESVRRAIDAAPEARRAEIQDANLAAFEDMTTALGLTALDRVAATLEAIAAEGAAEKAADEADGGGLTSPSRRRAEAADRMAAAVAEIERLRDVETEKLFQGVAAALAARRTDAEEAAPWEPFDAGPSAEPPIRDDNS